MRLTLFLILLYIIHLEHTEGISRCVSSEIGEGAQVNFLTGHSQELLPKCVSPIENLLNGRFRSGVNTGNHEALIPPWFNATLARIGQKFASKYWFSTRNAIFSSPLIFTVQKDISELMFYSGGLETFKTSVKRTLATSLQSCLWYEETSMPVLMESLNRVRTKHLVAMYHKKNNNKKPPLQPFKLDERIWAAFEEDLKVSYLKHRGIPEQYKLETPYGINQFGHASTLWGFAGLFIIRPEAFGMPDNPGTGEELEGFLHLWAFVGSALGVEDEYNVCLQPNINDAKIYFERFLYELMVPHLFHLSYEAKALIEISIKAFTEALGPEVQFDYELVKILENVLKIQAVNLNKQMGTMGRINKMFWDRFVFSSLRNSQTVRSVFNYIHKGYIQNLSIKVFGFDGTNRTVVSQEAFS